MHPELEKNYEILSLIGKGGMSAVYLAVHRRLQTRWAIKEVGKHQGETFDFLAEANILKRLQHPMLPRIVDIVEDPDHVWIVEDYVEGVSLDRWLEDTPRTDEAKGRVWFRDLCGVLQYLHSQKPNPIIYRDLKPSNIMLQPDGTLKLIDFGIAREYKMDSGGDTAYIGTKGYAAPEQFGAAQTDARTDIYSLGVTMYHLLTGKSPYQPPYGFVPARELAPGLSVGMEHILKKCLELEPENRYPHVRALLDDLEHIHRLDRAYQLVRRGRRNRRLAVAVLGLASAALIGSGYAIMGQERDASYWDLIREAEGVPAAEAAHILEQAMALYPHRPDAHRLQAYSLLQSGQFADCLDCAEEALALFPGDGELLLISASALFELEEYGAAADRFQRASGSIRLEDPYLMSYAVTLSRAGRGEEASGVLEELAARDGSAVEAQYVRGELALSLGQLDVAEAAFRSVLEDARDDSLTRRAYRSLAGLYRGQARWDACAGTAEEGLAQPALYGDTVLLEMRGEAYYNMGAASGNRDNLITAAQSFEQVVQSGVAKSYLYVNAFTAYQQAGAHSDAYRVMEGMKGDYPRDYTPYAMTATLMILEENEKPEGERDYTAAYGEYQRAAELAGAGSNVDTTQLQQLEGLIDQLYAGGWL